MVATSSFVLAASSIFPLALGAPVLRTASSVALSLVERAAFGGYRIYGGDGTTGKGWPAQSSWVPFEDAWQSNMDVLRSSCTQYPGSPKNNDDSEIKEIKAAIEDVSGESGLPKEFLLAVMMQESRGCVRAPTTNYGVRNPGLFQSFNGAATCGEGNFITPCPSSTITQMVREGAGIGKEFGLTQAIEQSKASDDSKFYKAARIYNSGSLPAGGNLGQGIATHCYASDIANRLMGWTDQASSCNEGSIGSEQGSSGSGNGSNNGEIQSPPETQNPPTTQQPPATDEGSAPKAEGAAANCKSWYTVKDGDNCSSTGTSFETLRKLNSGLDDKCSNLWLGYKYCIAA